MDGLARTAEPTSEDFALPFVKEDPETTPRRWTKLGDDSEVESNLGLSLTPSDSLGQPGFAAETQDQDLDDESITSVPASVISTTPGLPGLPGHDDSGELELSTEHTPLARRNNHLAVSIPTSTLIYPRSMVDGWLPPLPPVHESVALAALMTFVESQGDLTDEDFVEFELDNFSIYIRNNIYRNELRPLQQLATKARHDDFYFDGVLRIGDIEHYVEGVHFRKLPLGNYGISNASVGDQMWIHSKMNESREVYYQLKRPSAEYARFHAPFLWLADLAKHAVDFCVWRAKRKLSVELRHFKEKFIGWLLDTHKNAPSVERWHSKHGSNDYRSAVVANVDFVWKELYGLEPKKAASMHIFKEIKFFTRYEPAAALSDGVDVAPTVVTPYVFGCFGHMKFGRLLKVVGQKEPADEKASEAFMEGRESEDPLQQEDTLGILPLEDHHQARNRSRRRSSSADRDHREMIASIKPGDTISTPPDSQATGTKWKAEAAKGFVDDRRWFGLVQRVHVSSRTGARSFDVTWLYRPIDTPCCKMMYAWGKELFLSNHCTCDDGADARWDEDEVLETHNVDWFGNPETTTAEFFVRQTYMVEDRRWVSLEPKHMRCQHDIPEGPFYSPGDTVLASVSEEAEIAEPYEVVEVFGQGRSQLARLRRLRRRSAIEPRAKNIRPNELVYTDDVVVADTENIVGRCLVRFFRPDEPLPNPYNRDGTANVFFITHKLQLRDGKEVCVPFEDEYPPSMRQGFNPKRRDFRKMRGLDLFCGSGNFGRGLEEGGVVDMHWVNDIWDKAVHTYMANAPVGTHPFLGSVDDLLQHAIEGRYSNSVPRPGEVDFISGGSPCQGFSLLTDDKKCDRQVKNQSLVASFASFVDVYRPKYGILENVPAIVQGHKNREEDVFSQLICAIVGMGYQAQIIMGDAWSYGAPQNRSRVFLYFAAPTYRLPEAPLPSHSHHAGSNSRALGVMSNGEPYVRRSFKPTAFKFVSAAEATADLPQVDDGKPDCCVGFPDHRIQLGVTPCLRFQFNLIPTHPYGMNFATAWEEGKGVMTLSERELFPRPGCARTASNSKGWGRIRPVDVFPTVTTRCGPSDSRTGRLLHWWEHRPITIMEARRAQGYLDHEVLLGTPPEQWKLVGNSVARQMALALGLQFREAWLGSLYEDHAIAVPAAQACQAPLNTAVLVGPETLAEETTRPGDWAMADSVSTTRESSNPIDEPRLSRGPASTPPTSASESTEARPIDPTGGPRKRSLSLALAVELHSSKKMQRLGAAQPPDGCLGLPHSAAAEHAASKFGLGLDGNVDGDSRAGAAATVAEAVLGLDYDDFVDELSFEV